MNCFDEKLARCDTGENTLPDSLFFDFFKEVLCNLIIDISLKKGNSDLPKGVFDVIFCNFSIAPNFFKSGFKALLQFLKHNLLE